MNRRKAREYVLQKLFQSEFDGDHTIPLPEGHQAAVLSNPELKKFADELANGTLEHIREIDLIIQKAADNWEMSRMAVVDRNILRCATFELAFRADIPPAVTINEALEIAKKYSSLDAVPFINGLLDKIAHTVKKA
jgi:transcription antitermination protein NusB